MKVRYNVPKRIVLSVAVLTVESVDRALMPSSIEVRAGTWLRTVHRKEARIEVMLILDLIHGIQKQSSLIEEHVLRSEGNGGAGEVH